MVQADRGTAQGVFHGWATDRRGDLLKKRGHQPPATRKPPRVEADHQRLLFGSGRLQLTGDQVQQAALAAAPRSGQSQHDRVGTLCRANRFGKGAHKRHPIEPIETRVGDRRVGNQVHWAW